VASFCFETGQRLLQSRIAHGQDLHRQQPGVPGRADADGGHRHARRHLHNREQRVEALERFAFNGHADDGQDGERRRNARQMRRAARAGDDDAQAALVRTARVGFQIPRRAVGRNDLRFAGVPNCAQTSAAAFIVGQSSHCPSKYQPPVCQSCSLSLSAKLPISKPKVIL